MALTDNVPRITPPQKSRFFAEYVAPRRPVVLRGLFDTDRIREIRTEGAARSELGDMALMTMWSYGARLGFAGRLEGETDGFVEMTLREYLTYVEEHSRTPRMCIEQPLPRPLRERISMPDYVGDDAPSDLESLLFVGNRGNTALMHFDADHRHVLLHQVFGRKLVVLVAPRFAPSVRPWSNLSLLDVGTFGARDWDDFVAKNDASVTTLGPGETFFIPALYWHYVVYIDTGMSFNLRFGRNAPGRFLHANVYPDAHLQNFGALLLGRGPLDAERERAFDAVREACCESYPDSAAKHRAVRAAVEARRRGLQPEVSLDLPPPPSPWEARESISARQFYDRLAAGTGGHP